MAILTPFNCKMVAGFGMLLSPPSLSGKCKRFTFVHPVTNNTLKVTVLKSWIIIILEKEMDRSYRDTKVINRVFISYVTD